MRTIRFSIAGLMGAVAMSAVGIAALRAADSTAWAGAMLMLVCGVLALAIVGALCRRDSERAWWLGFALFGCGYLMLAFWSENGFDELPTTKLLLFLSSKFDPTIRQNTWSPSGSRRWTYLQIAHCIWSLLAAAVGGTLARVLFAASEQDREQPIVDPDTGSQLPQKWRRGPVVIWLIGLARRIGHTGLLDVGSRPLGRRDRPVDLRDARHGDPGCPRWSR